MLFKSRRHSRTNRVLVKQATQGSSTLTYTYDALGRNTSESSPRGTMSYEFDFAGRRVKTTWPDGFYTSQAYLVIGEMSEIRENSTTPGWNALAYYVYDNLGRRTQSQRANGAWGDYAYDGISRLSGLSHNLTGTAADVGTSFTYNPASQIATSIRNNDSYAWGGHYNVNRTDTINGLNQAEISGSVAIGYDNRGNLTSSGVSAYSYTAENRLVSGPSGATFTYDPSGRLSESSSSVIPLTRFQYDGTDLVTEYDAWNVVKRRYVHGPGADEPLVWYEGSDTTNKRWYHHDERGSVVGLSNSFGASISINTYDEYGIPGVGNVGRFSYTGQTWLPEIGMYYYKARMYSPELGRFMQTDSVGYADGMNLYAYVGGDAVNHTDPTGNAANTGSSQTNVGECTGTIIVNKDGTCGSQGTMGRVLPVWIKRAKNLHDLQTLWDNAFRREEPGAIDSLAAKLGIDAKTLQLIRASSDLTKAAAAAKIVTALRKTGYQWRYIGLGGRSLVVQNGYRLTMTATGAVLFVSFVGGFAIGTGIDRGLDAFDICIGCGAYNFSHDEKGALQPILGSGAAAIGVGSIISP